MRESDNYLGLPTPANAILICSLILFILNIEKYQNFKSIVNINDYNILFLAIINSILLMSKVDYEKFQVVFVRRCVE